MSSTVAASAVDRLKGAAIGRLGGAMLTALMSSARYEIIHGEEFGPERLRPDPAMIYVLWHGRLLPCSYPFRHLRLGTLVSRNRDGDYIAGVVQRWGFLPVRGSSSSGGAGALRALVRALRAGTSIALTPDGPRGPRQRMKMGPLIAARLAGVPIVPVTAGASAAWYVGKWDRFLVPRPFTWVPIAFGAPLHIPAGADDEQVAARAKELESTLTDLTELVDAAARDRPR